MKSLFAANAVAALFTVTAFAQPRVARVQNNYSYILPGMPNYGIAQGSISSPITDFEARKFPYLQAVIKEGLRILPPASGTFFKTLSKSIRQNGLLIKSLKVISLHLIGNLNQVKPKKSSSPGL